MNRFDLELASLLFALIAVLASKRNMQRGFQELPDAIKQELLNGNKKPRTVQYISLFLTLFGALILGGDEPLRHDTSSALILASPLFFGVWLVATIKIVLSMSRIIQKGNRYVRAYVIDKILLGSMLSVLLFFAIRRAIHFG